MKNPLWPVAAFLAVVGILTLADDTPDPIGHNRRREDHRRPVGRPRKGPPKRPDPVVEDPKDDDDDDDGGEGGK